jgi:hypothetical protein
MTVTLRDAMRAREGADRAEFQIGRGMRAFAVERESPCLHRTDTAIVFGRSPSDAKRAASAPARLGEGCHGDVTRVAPIVAGWDEAVAWPEFAC